MFGGWVFVVQPAVHIATVGLQILPCGFLTGLSIHYPICISLTLTLSLTHTLCSASCSPN